ncbi:MAG: hypothetical protein VZS44_12605, partial [Bacilli bacterium]|nr:hypothetical protein [Bacilli bacterium]
DFYRDINSVFADVSSNLFFHKINPSQQRKFVLAKSNKTLFSEPNIVNERKIFNSSIDTKSIDTHQELSYAEVITPTNVHIVKDDDEDGSSIKVFMADGKLIHSTILNPFWAYRTNNPKMSLTDLYEAIKYSILFKINYHIFKVTKTPIKITLDTNIDKIINAQNTKKWF